MRILLISCSFPPIGGMTPLLAAQFVRHLTVRGHAVEVLTIRPSAKHPRYKFDAQIGHLVPSSVQVHRTYAGPIHHAAKHIVADGMGVVDLQTTRNRRKRLKLKERLALWARPFLIPDSRVDWFPWAFGTGMKLIRRGHYDVLFSIAPPDSDNLIGYALSRFGKLPWVVHQGDLWSVSPVTDSQNLPKWRRALDRIVEARLLRRMDRVIVVSDGMKDLYLRNFPFLAEDKFVVATVGYDAEEYNRIAPESPQEGMFRIVYTGSFYPGIRDPDIFFEAYSDFSKGRDDVELAIATNAGPQYRQRVEELGMAHATRFLGYQPHDRVVALQKGASVLLLLGWVGGIGLTAKLIEYLAAKRPILAVRYDTLDPAARMVSERRQGLAVENDRVKLREILQNLYSLWKTGRLERSFDLPGAPEFSWERIVDKVEAALSAACNGGGAAKP